MSNPVHRKNSKCQVTVLFLNVKKILFIIEQNPIYVSVCLLLDSSKSQPVYVFCRFINTTTRLEIKDRTTIPSENKQKNSKEFMESRNLSNNFDAVLPMEIKRWFFRIDVIRITIKVYDIFINNIVIDGLFL